jgi:hypothetical protein
VILAVGAIVTAILAGLAFREQAEEVRAIEQQVADAQKLAQQQADQLELQRQQLDDQREANARQAEILGLQANELRESLAERKREAEQRYRAQASAVFISQRFHSADARGVAAVAVGRAGGRDVTMADGPPLSDPRGFPASAALACHGERVFISPPLVIRVTVIETS